MILSISAIKFLRGGPLRILEELIIGLAGSNHRYKKIYIFVHRNCVLPVYNDDTIVIVRVNRIFTSSHILRFFWECIWSNILVRQYKISHWFSLHDVSSAPFSKVRRMVYIHSPMMFVVPQRDWIKHSRSELLFSLVYPLLMKYFVIGKDIVVVQQKWFAEKLAEHYFKNSQIVVSHPRTIFHENSEQIYQENVISEDNDNKKLIFFYPSMVRSFKGHSFLFQIATVCPEFEFYITVERGGETLLERRLWAKYGGLKNVRWLGYLSKVEIADVYRRCDYVIFPSEIETWGLPLSEARHFEKPVIVFDGAEYFRGPLNGYKKTYIFPRVFDHFSRNLAGKEKFICNFVEENSGPNWFELINNVLLDD